jgi:hypothetical protein
MKKYFIAGAALVGFLSFAVAAGDIKSGPQVGEKLPGPFHPLNINGSAAGKKNCLYCSNGDNPVAMIFAKEDTEQLNGLIRKIDACTAKHSDCSMGSFVVFCSDDKNLEEQLKNVVKDADLKQTILAIDNPGGPDKYNVSKDAAVTVVLYRERTVKANYSYASAKELTDKEVDKILGEVAKILPEKK